MDTNQAAVKIELPVFLTQREQDLYEDYAMACATEAYFEKESELVLQNLTTAQNRRWDAENALREHLKGV